MKEVLRMCIVCRQMKDRNTLLRFVKLKDGSIDLDLTGKADGRGAYVCSCEECISKLQKTKALNRAFKMPIDEKIYESIKNLKEN